jgi:hypothetical protein
LAGSAGDPAGIGHQPAFQSLPAGFSHQQSIGASAQSFGYPVPAAPYYPGNVSRVYLRSGHAKASLVLGILGVFTAGLMAVGSLIGLTLGIRAVVKANREPNLYGGKGIAIGGILTNSLGLLSIVPIALIAAIVVPNIAKIRMTANEVAAITVLDDIVSAQNQRFEDHRQFGTMVELIADGSLPSNIQKRSGYHFTIKLVYRNPELYGDDVPGFEAVAVPDTFGVSGGRSFYTDETYVIRHSNVAGQEANADSPPVDDDLSFIEKEWQ